jgi:sigma-B regulation protein RsbU (phosphoserine phosphatase)
MWDELAALAGDPKGERALVARALQAWCAERGIASGALYLETERGLRRECVVGAAGSGGYPTLLPKSLRDQVAIELPGAVLLVPAAAAARAREVEDPLQALLVAAVGLARARQQLKAQHFQVNYRVVELEALYDVGLAIAGTLDLERLSEEILLRAVSLIDARRGALYVVEDGVYQLRGTIGGSAAERIAAGDPALRSLLATGDGAGELLPGATFTLGVGIESDGQPEGVLAVADKESREGVGPFTDNDRRTLSLFANQAAIALENAKLHRAALEKERLEREMELAADIQRRILPKGAPQVPGFDLAGWYRPARQVGGDYFDFLPLAAGRLGLTLGDVSGKGVPAALMVSTLHSALRLLLEGNEVGPHLLSRLNQHIVDSSTPNKFITLFLAELDPASGGLTYLNAGHNPGLLLRAATGNAEELPAGGLPLGLLPHTSYRDERLTLDADDLLCLFSDGITEAASPLDDEFGTARLVELLRGGARRPLPELAETIGEAVRAFAAGRPQGDDQTVVLLRRHPA